LQEEVVRNIQAMDNSVPRWLKILLVFGVLTAVGLFVAAGVLLFSMREDEAEAGPDPVDVGFSQDMSLHHLQAIQMANVARDRSGDVAVRQLAFDIETSQLGQVGRMGGWLSMWHEPELPPGASMTWMRGSGTHGMHHGQHGELADPHAPMPGMATGAELDRLHRLSGRDLDVYFLQLMLRHHEGGVPMLSEAAERATIPQVRTLAATMLTSQRAEAEVMKQMLNERGAQPLPN
jgi:uncharacterized protein (DUF305 family)